jgi:hypothetical protein
MDGYEEVVKEICKSYVIPVFQLKEGLLMSFYLPLVKFVKNITYISRSFHTIMIIRS